MACFKGSRQRCAPVLALVALRILILCYAVASLILLYTRAAIRLGWSRCDAVCKELGVQENKTTFLVPDLFCPAAGGLVLAMRLITASLPAQPGHNSVAASCVQPLASLCSKTPFKVRRIPANKRDSTKYVSRCCLQTHAAYSPVPAPLGCQAAERAWRPVASTALVVTGGARRACH